MRGSTYKVRLCTGHVNDEPVQDEDKNKMASCERALDSYMQRLRLVKRSCQVYEVVYTATAVCMQRNVVRSVMRC